MDVISSRCGSTLHNPAAASRELPGQVLPAAADSAALAAQALFPVLQWCQQNYIFLTDGGDGRCFWCSRGRTEQADLQTCSPEHLTLTHEARVGVEVIICL